MYTSIITSYLLSASSTWDHYCRFRRVVMWEGPVRPSPHYVGSFTTILVCLLWSYTLYMHSAFICGISKLVSGYVVSSENSADLQASSKRRFFRRLMSFVHNSQHFGHTLMFVRHFNKVSNSSIIGRFFRNDQPKFLANHLWRQFARWLGAIVSLIINWFHHREVLLFRLWWLHFLCRVQLIIIIIIIIIIIVIIMRVIYIAPKNVKQTHRRMLIPPSKTLEKVSL